MSDDGETPRPGGSRGQGPRARQAPNVKPKLTTQSSSKDNRRRREKPAKVRRSKSTDSERVERGRRRERDRHQGERSQRGRSEEGRASDRREGDAELGSAKPPRDTVEDSECAVCFCTYDNIFKTPKLLACGHTFCLECLARINVTSPDFKTLTCPVCRELTDLPHGRDLPRLGNNEEIIGKLPPDMHRALSIRFKRSKGKLLLKTPARHGPVKSSVLALPVKSQESQETAGAHLGTVDQGIAPTTVVDVGRPPNRVRGRLRRLFRSDQCYYAVVGSIIAVAVVLLLVGILAFAIIPSVGPKAPPPGNHTVNAGGAAGPQGPKP